MRIRRILTTVVAVVVALVLLPLGAATTAVAAEKDTREVAIKVTEPRDQVFVVKGKVGPTYKKRNMIIQRKLKGASTWKTYKRITTNGRSRYRARIQPKKSPGIVYYRARVPASGTWAVSYSFRVGLETSKA